MEVSLMVLGKSALKMAVAAAISFLITQQLHWDYTQSGQLSAVSSQPNADS